MEVPKTSAEWKNIEKHFLQLFLKCCESIYGKHVVSKSPPFSCSKYYSYKNTFRIISLALVDVNYCFTYVGIGSNGRASYISRDSTSKIAIENKLETHVIVRDGAFLLKIKWLSLTVKFE